jgi:hypothetical protein
VRAALAVRRSQCCSSVLVLEFCQRFAQRLGRTAAQGRGSFEQTAPLREPSVRSYFPQALPSSLEPPQVSLLEPWSYISSARRRPLRLQRGCIKGEAISLNIVIDQSRKPPRDVAFLNHLALVGTLNRHSSLKDRAYRHDAVRHCTLAWFNAMTMIELLRAQSAPEHPAAELIQRVKRTVGEPSRASHDPGALRPLHRRCLRRSQGSFHDSAISRRDRSWWRKSLQPLLHSLWQSRVSRHLLAENVLGPGERLQFRLRQRNPIAQALRQAGQIVDRGPPEPLKPDTKYYPSKQGIPGQKRAG